MHGGGGWGSGIKEIDPFRHPKKVTVGSCQERLPTTVGCTACRSVCPNYYNHYTLSTYPNYYNHYTLSVYPNYYNHYTLSAYPNYYDHYTLSAYPNYYNQYTLSAYPNYYDHYTLTFVHIHSMHVMNWHINIRYNSPRRTDSVRSVSGRCR